MSSTVLLYVYGTYICVCVGGKRMYWHIVTCTLYHDLGALCCKLLNHTRISNTHMRVFVSNCSLWNCSICRFVYVQLVFSDNILGEFRFPRTKHVVSGPAINTPSPVFITPNRTSQSPIHPFPSSLVSCGRRIPGNCYFMSVKTSGLFTTGLHSHQFSWSIPNPYYKLSICTCIVSYTYIHVHLLSASSPHPCVTMATSILERQAELRGDIHITYGSLSVTWTWRL